MDKPETHKFKVGDLYTHIFSENAGDIYQVTELRGLGHDGHVYYFGIKKGETLVRNHDESYMALSQQHINKQVIKDFLGLEDA